ncbi:hypothetical protein B566_EDAN006687, partial [Ephemera danica]
MENNTLSFKGSNFLRQRLVLSILSGKTVRINDIRSKDTDPGLREFEINLIRLLDKMTNGTQIVVSESGTSLFFQPGILSGGSIDHDCCPQRGIGYYLEVIVSLGPFCKKPLNCVLKGATNNKPAPHNFLKATTVNWSFSERVCVCIVAEMLRRTSSQQTDLVGVLVEAQLGDTKASCSGLMFAGGCLVLTHGVLLTAIKCPNKPERRGQLMTPPNIASLQLRIRHDDTQRASRCSLDAWWICPLLVSTAKDLHFEGWRFSPEDGADYESLGMMLVLAVDSRPKLDVRAALSQLMRDHVYTGTAAVGNRISAVSGEQNSMLLCDVHAAPGSEGGALYLKDQDNTRGRLLGLVVLPFSVVRGEAVALCLCVALAPMLNRLLGQNGPLPAITSLN